MWHATLAAIFKSQRLGNVNTKHHYKDWKEDFWGKKIWYPHPRGCSNLANILKSQILSKVSALAYFMITIVIINIINIIIIIIIIILFISQQPGKYFQKSAP